MTSADLSYLSESREDLELRFRVLAQVFVNARSKTVCCDLSKCDCCEILHDVVNIPDTMLVPGHEPREDLEAAVRAVADRLNLATIAPDAIDCPGGRWLRHMRSKADGIVEAREDE